MRRKCLTLVSLLVAVAAWAGRTDRYVLYENFESGSMDSVKAHGWTLETVQGTAAWTLESGATSSYPRGSYAGQWHLALRNLTGQTQHYVSRLISPVMNLRDVYHPLLVFSHAQPQRTGDVDTLRIYYRTSNSMHWVELASYDKSLISWKTDTVQLPAANDTYQVMFEGVDNFGRGIVLDDIIVRPEPVCDVPTGIEAVANAHSAEFSWTGSLDALSFDVTVSERDVADADLLTEEDITWRGTTEDYFIRTPDSVLVRGMAYYVYIRSNCPNDETAWGKAAFSTKNLQDLPYRESFNTSYIQGNTYHVDYWTHNTNILLDDGTTAFMPFINSGTLAANWGNYSYSSTTVLAFTGRNNSVDIPVPGGYYEYAATAEINAERLSELQVTFWGTGNNVAGSTYKLIVGVMTDPNDFSTFVPVDTAVVENMREFKEFVIPLAGYQGNGKYIAFASNFAEPNIFFMDDLTIEKAKALPKPAINDIKALSATRLQIHPDLKGATTYNLRFVKDNGLVYVNGSQVGADLILLEQTGLTGSSHTVDLPAELSGSYVQVYVQTQNGTAVSDWSLPVMTRLPLAVGDSMMPYTIGFEQAETPTWAIGRMYNFMNAGISTTNYSYTFPLGIHSGYVSSCVTANSSKIPQRTASQSGHNSNYALSLIKEVLGYADGTYCYLPYGQYVVLPEVSDVKGTVLKFYLKAKTENTGNSRVAVGVMTDANDISTFTELARYDGTEAYVPVIVDFSKYTGTGRFMAIAAVNAASSEVHSTSASYTSYYTSQNLIDDITLMKQGECMEPSEVKAVTTHDQTTITWNGHEATSWLVQVSRAQNMASPIYSDTVTTTSVTVQLSQHTTYYYQLTAICGGSTVASDVYSTTTACAPKQGVPYVENFNSYSINSAEPFCPYCWTMPQIKVAYYNVYLPTVNSTGYSGNGLYFGYQYYGNAAYFALPVIEDSLQGLQISFWARGAEAKNGSTNIVYNDTLWLGVMTDPDDFSTFTKVADVPIHSATYREYIYHFNDYKGSGKHIALYKPQRQDAHNYLIDEIRVDYYNSCEKVQNVSASNPNQRGATVSWTKTGAEKYDIIVSKANSMAEADIMLRDTVAGSNYAVDMAGATPNTVYYVFVQGICGEVTGDWSNAVSFRTTCEPMSPEGSSMIWPASAAELTCWTLGVQQGTTSVPTHSTVYKHSLYLYNSAASDGAYAIMPPIDTDSIKNVQVSFYVGTTSTLSTNTNRLAVGVISNASDLSTFTKEKDIHYVYVAAADTAKMLRQTVRFTNYEGDYNGNFGNQVMFLMETGDSTNYAYIRKIEIEKVAACPEPVEVVTDSVGTYGAHLTWDGNADSYQVIVYQGTDTVFNKVVQGNSTEVGGLMQTTTYTMQVRALCSASESSAWSNIRTFTTQCPVEYPLPYSETFEAYGTGAGNQPYCWATYYNGREGTAVTYPYVYSTAAMSGSRGYYMANGFTVGSSYAALPRLSEPMNKTMLSFNYKANSAAARYLAIGVADSVGTLEELERTLVIVDTVTSLVTTAARYFRRLDDVKTEGRHLVFISYNGTGSGSSIGGMYIDNVLVEKIPTCYHPQTPVMTSSTTTSLGVSWKRSLDEVSPSTKWDVTIVPAGTDPAAGTIVTVDTLGHKFIGLTHSTAYDICVRTNCGAGDVSEWSKATYSTACLYELANAHWDFDDAANKHASYSAATSGIYVIDNCWDTYWDYTTNGTYIPYTVANATTGSAAQAYSRSGNYALKISSTFDYDGSYAILPFVNANYDTLQLRLHVRPTYHYSEISTTAANRNKIASSTASATVQVFAASDVYDASTYEKLYEQKVTMPGGTLYITDEGMDGYWTELDVPLYGTDGRAVVIGSKVGGTNTYYVDDVSFITASGCLQPTFLKFNEETFTATNADFSWKSGAEKWEVRVSDGTSNLVETVTATPNLTVNMLVPSKSYTLYVTAVCGDGTKSMESALTFTTPCLPSKAGTSWDFNNAAELTPYTSTATYVIPYCWSAATWFAGGSLLTYSTYAIPNTATAIYAHDGAGTTNRAIRFDATGTTSSNKYYNHCLALPEVDVDYERTALRFYFRATNHNNSTGKFVANSAYNKQLVIGAVTNMSDMASFTPLDTVVYPYTVTTSNLAADYPDNGWIEANIPLKNYKGRGRIAFFYGPASGSTTHSYFYVDDVSLVNSDCDIPVDISFDESTFNATNADFSWTASGDKWNVVIKNEGTVVVDTVVNSPHLNVSTLVTLKTYDVSVTTLCDDNARSLTASASFTMPCLPYDVGSTWGFSADEGLTYRTASSTYVLPYCWDGGTWNYNTTSEIYTTYAIPNTASVCYAHDGTTTANRAIQFRTRYLTSGATQYQHYNQYLAMPQMNIDYDSAALHFYYRAASHNISTGKFVANSGYNKKLVIGAVTDLGDMASFTPLDSVVYPYTLTTSNLAADYPDNGWMEATFSLKKYEGKGRIAFFYGYPNGSADNYFYIDDVSIVNADFCSPITVSAVDASARRADIRWDVATGDTAVVLQVAADEDFSDIVFTDTIRHALTREVTGLLPNTKYYYRLQHLCNNSEVSDLLTNSFRTLHEPRFYEAFNAPLTVPENWGRYSGSVDGVMAGTTELKEVAGTSVSAAWNYGTGDMNATEYAPWSANIQTWLITPGIDLTGKAGGLLSLSFDMALRSASGGEAGTANTSGDRFIVLVSTDNGSTWPKADATIWANNGSGSRVLRDVTHEMTTACVDLSKHAGQRVRIAFVVASAGAASGNRLYIDNVQVHDYTMSETTADVCQYDDYSDDNFVVENTLLKLGENVFEKFIASRSNTVNDRLYRLTLNVTEAKETSLQATVCGGDTYSENGFVIAAVENNVYKQKLTSSTGCDSIVSLHLTVNRRFETSVMDTICQGQGYSFGGETLYTATIKSDTLTSDQTGCDSIVTLYLNVTPAKSSEEDVNLCYGGSLVLGGRTITAAGTYSETLQTSTGCDSVVTWHVTALPEYASETRRAICQGETYTAEDNTFVGLSRQGVYTMRTQSAEGCDSVVTLKLLVATAEGLIVDTVSAEELPYVVNGQELFAAGLGNGEYTAPLVLSCGSVTVRLRVGDNTRLGENRAGSLVVTPNPVGVYEPFFIDGDLPSSETVVEVFNSTGTLVYRSRAAACPVSIPGLPASGLYTIRLTAGQYSVFHGKVIVK